MYNSPMIGFEEAHGAIEAMVEEVKSNPDRYWQHGCMVVVDNTGVPVCVAKMDGGSYQTYEQALRKAYTAALWRMATNEFHDLISKRDWSEQTYGTKYTVCPGGVAIVPPEYEADYKGRPQCLGAIGVSCVGEFDADDQLAQVGLNYIKSILWPSK